MIITKAVAVVLLSPNMQKQATPIKILDMKNELSILSRPTRTIKPTLKALEKMSLS